MESPIYSSRDCSLHRGELLFNSNLHEGVRGSVFNKWCSMSRLSWEKDSLRRKLQKLDGSCWEQRKLHPIPNSLNELFEKAIQRTNGSSGYSAAWSIRRHFLKRGWLSAKQSSYLRDLAGPSAPAPLIRPIRKIGPV